MAHRALHLACYDVACPDRLRAALEVSRRFATGGQKSVHECWLTDNEKGRLRDLLCGVIDPAEDRVLIVALDPRRKAIPLGAATSPVDRDVIVIGGPP
jgi:CRISPR-associated protein Cas2